MSKNGIRLHSDLRTQYTSRAFEECLKEKGILHSFSRKGIPYDNACIESFHSILKKEEVNQNEYYLNLLNLGIIAREFIVQSTI